MKAKVAARPTRKDFVKRLPSGPVSFMMVLRGQNVGMANELAFMREHGVIGPNLIVCIEPTRGAWGMPEVVATTELAHPQPHRIKLSSVNGLCVGRYLLDAYNGNAYRIESVDKRNSSVLVKRIMAKKKKVKKPCK